MSEVNKMIDNIAKELSGEMYWLIGFGLELFIPAFRKIIIELLNGMGPKIFDNLINLDKIMIYIFGTYLLIIIIEFLLAKIKINLGNVYAQWYYFLNTLLNPCVMWGQLIINSIYINTFKVGTGSNLLEVLIFIVTFLQAMLAISVVVSKFD
ncbi:MAG: hypothetical protein ACI31O_01170 [Limosilactobacillus vaginalis]|uniref:hypothetical protein n=1 Tax=Limosilactobacillus vaginalis TaxID=1633 RepID=UPI003F0B76BC